MNKIAFFYKLGHQMAKIANEEETFGKIYKRQVPYWMWVSGLWEAARAWRHPTSLARALGTALIKGPITGAMVAIPAASITKATTPKKKKWFSSD